MARTLATIRTFGALPILVAATFVACGSPDGSAGEGVDGATHDVAVEGGDDGGLDLSISEAMEPDADAGEMGVEVSDVGPDVVDVGPDVVDVGPDVVDVGPDVVDVGPDVVDVGPDVVDMGPDVVDVGPDIVDVGPDVVDVGPDVAEVSVDCDVVAQTGCKSGEKCAYGTPPTCVATGTVATGLACGSAGDDCVAGDVCIGLPLVCTQFCNVDADCKQPAVASGTTPEPNNVARCDVTLTGSATKLCSTPCNPVPGAGASGCVGGLICVYGSDAASHEVTDCFSPGTLVEGAACTTSDACAAGLTCVGTSASTSHCRQVCRNAKSTDCGVAGDVCFAPSGIASPMFGFCCPTSGC